MTFQNFPDYVLVTFEHNGNCAYARIDDVGDIEADNDNGEVLALSEREETAIRDAARDWLNQDKPMARQFPPFRR